MHSTMDPDEETKRMLPAAQPVPMSDLEMNETASALRSSQDDPPLKESKKAKRTVATVYTSANYFASLRFIFALPMLVSSAWMVSRGTSPSTSWIVLPWASYCIVCVSN
jgi:hypothetical protein